jgi:cell division protein FtsQ
VVGTRRYTSEQITSELIKTKIDSNSLYLYLKHQYFTTVKLPFVEKIDVTMSDTHTITVYVYEKMVAGCVEFMGEHMYFDKDGIIVESSSQRLEEIPVIKGLKFDKIMLSEKLEVQKDELFDVIINLTQLVNKYELDVDTITFSSDYEVTLDCGDVKVLLGKKSTYDEALSELNNILEEAKGMKITLDMRNYVKGTQNIIGKRKNPTE